MCSGRTSAKPELSVGQVSNFFCLVGGSSQKQVAYTSTLLQGAAQTWWQRKVRYGEDPQDWQLFGDQLIQQFRNTNKLDSTMAALMNMR